MWKALDNPWLSRAGTAVFLVGAVQSVVRWLMGLPLNVIGVGLLFVGVALLLLSQRRGGLQISGKHAAAGETEKPQGLSVDERRKRLDDKLYPPADDRLELGEECAGFAMKMRIFNEEQEWKREKTIARFVEELRETETDLDPFKAREKAEDHFERNVEVAYAMGLREEALSLFDKARDQGASAAKTRRLTEKPHAAEMYEIPHLFRAMARRLGYEPPSEYGGNTYPPPPDLAAELDDFLREGMGLVAEFDVPVSPEQVAGGVWKLEAGAAPDDWWKEADGFAQRIRDLLFERHPALLKDYATGYNAQLQKERKERATAKPEPDMRPLGEKLLELANYERSGPRRVVEASLEGLAAARHRLGDQEA